MNKENELEKYLDSLSGEELLEIRDKLSKTKVNVLIVGGTGAGKSSTINALFNMEAADIGEGYDPKTNEIKKYELSQLILWDSPGLGDNQEQDNKHINGIKNKLSERDDNGDLLIDLVLLIIDGSTRDFSSAYTLLKNVILPSLGENQHNRVLVGINQADLAMKGAGWNKENNEPEASLLEHLDKVVKSTQKRIKEDTGLDITPIYYSAGNPQLSGGERKPYNLSYLMHLILSSLPTKKRFVVFGERNTLPKNWEKGQNSSEYNKENEKMAEESWQDWLKSLGKKFADELKNKISELVEENKKEIAQYVVKLAWNILKKKK